MARYRIFIDYSDGERDQWGRKEDMVYPTIEEASKRVKFLINQQKDSLVRTGSSALAFIIVDESNVARRMWEISEIKYR